MMADFDSILNDPATVRTQEASIPKTWGTLRLQSHVLASIYLTLERATLTPFQSKFYGELGTATELLYGTGCQGSGKTFAACVFAVDTVMKAGATEGIKVVYFIPTQQDTAYIKDVIFKLHSNIKVSLDPKPVPDVLLVTLDNIAHRMVKTTVQASAGCVSLVVVDEAEEMLGHQDRRKNVGELLVSLYASKENGVPTHLLLGNFATDYLTKFYQEITQCINKQFKLVINPRRVEDSFNFLRAVPQYYIEANYNEALVYLVQQRTRRLTKPCIVICQSSDQADQVHRLLEDRGHLAEMYMEGPSTAVAASNQMRKFNYSNFKFLICLKPPPRQIVIEPACCVVILGLLRDNSFNVDVEGHAQAVMRAFKAKSVGFVLNVLLREEQTLRSSLERELGYSLVTW
jgi:superfamily II DNA/RNA helicase